VAPDGACLIETALLSNSRSSSRNASNVPRQSSAFARHESELQILPTQNIFVILPCRALTLGLRSPEPTRFASLSRNLPWPNGKFVASHSEYAYFEARFQDWVNAEKLNDQINVFNLRAEQLYEALQNGKLDPAVLQNAADALLPGLFQTQPS